MPERVAGRIPIAVKVNGNDFLQKDGWGLEETCRLARVLEQEGAAYISVTAGVMGGTRLTVPPLYEKQGCFADMAGEVRKHVTIPVATIGRIKNPAMANDLVRRRCGYRLHGARDDRRSRRGRQGAPRRD